MTDHVEVRCVVCPQLHSRAPRHYERAQVCEPCRARLAQTLTDIGRGHGDLPQHLERGAGFGQYVRGGEVEAPLPFREDVWDLLLPVRPTPNVVGLDDLLCQIGHVSVATLLDSWIRDWCHLRGKSERGRPGYVSAMVVWLGNRLEWACDHHPAVDEFASEINGLWSVMRRYVGVDEPRPTPCRGVPCRRCDLKTLARLADGSGDVECQNAACRTVYRADEYTRWVRLVAAAVSGG